ncbi:hypothetical protein BJF78_00800 [Pseudonocardia sp. CNS-139]|nr:hypothetical protein BJF78_00800 [Pseudonocardia sp. CNS-139]
MAMSSGSGHMYACIRENRRSRTRSGRRLRANASSANATAPGPTVWTASDQPWSTQWSTSARKNSGGQTCVPK